MVFLTQALCCSGTFGEAKFRHTGKNEAVKNRSDTALELKLIKSSNNNE